ncbi:hypothetical protein RD1_1873 [Roseobacter denitrificans OCh 114]|uniref:Uncharacterized protein n=1 Tax=Roseobacter denitrificans (strain ATCC 33942 / OCh 114) TaxID=375451 RepID=Q168V9_ROSDO|nr:hypothetical protein RD1_1873 [Roseobacter denitrificans OCh 114]
MRTRQQKLHRKADARTARETPWYLVVAHYRVQSRAASPAFNSPSSM